MPSDENTQTNGGSTVRVEEDELYAVVHSAVKDALLDTIGTLALLAFALLAVAIGAYTLIAPEAASGSVVGFALLLFGFGLAAATLELIPPFRD